jgi:transposase
LPSSKDVVPEKRKTRKKTPSGKKAGAQDGHKGASLKHFENPDKIVRLELDESQLPPGEWVLLGYRVHQVVSIKTRRYVTQYEAQLWGKKDGEQEFCKYPEGCKPPDESQTVRVGVEGIKPAKELAKAKSVVIRVTSDESAEPEPELVTAPASAAGNASDESAEAEPELAAEPAIPTEHVSDESAEAEPEFATAPASPAGNASDEPAEPEPELAAEPASPAGNASDKPAEAEPELAAAPASPAGNASDEPGDVRGEVSPRIEVLKSGTCETVKLNDKLTGFGPAFPEGAKAPIQYDNTVKAHAILLSIQQLVPCQRSSDYFKTIFDIPISPGTLCSFVKQAAERLMRIDFPEWSKRTIIASEVINADETGINVLGKSNWLHIACTEDAVHGVVAKSRSGQTIEDIGILSETGAVICHDHYAAYNRFDQTLHSLCNAHLIRELEGLVEKGGLKWPSEMIEFLRSLNKEVDGAGGRLDEARQQEVKNAFREILRKGAEECPLKPKPPGKKGRAPKSKGRHLVDRLEKDIDDVLRFMTDVSVPFTNNLAERTVRALKIKLKISGCFRTLVSANEFILIRSFLQTCVRRGVEPHQALLDLFDGKTFSFMSEKPLTPPSLSDEAHPQEFHAPKAA